MQVLFICTGNTCRSPMAEALFNQKKEGKTKAISAGLYAPAGQGASPFSLKVMEKRALDLSRHRSAQLTKELIQKSDLVLTMTENHKAAILQNFAEENPEQRNKVFTIKEFVSGSGDVEDPYGGTLEDYEQVAKELESLVLQVLEKIKREDAEMSDEIALGSDHGGFELKEALKAYLDDKKIAYKDYGCFNLDAVDYPDIAFRVAAKVAAREHSLGILLCGTGIGMSIAANKIKGIRAALVGDSFSAKMAKEHNNSNILVLGGRVLGRGLALDIVEAFLNAEFKGNRHVARLNKISDRENGSAE